MPRSPSAVKVFYKQSFQDQYSKRPPVIQKLFDTLDTRFQAGDAALLNQGWMYYHSIDDGHVAMGMYPKNPDKSEFLWLSFCPTKELPLVL